MPSVKSREISFYYGHPQNRFWSVLSEVFEENIGKSIDDKRIFLHHRHIALYDVIDQCDILGSSDASIKNPVITDIFSILKATKIKKILLNGKKAGNLFAKYQKTIIESGIPFSVLPSTSPANAAMRLDDLVRIWKEALSES